MKESMIWLFLWCKRLMKKPLLLFTILLMPLATLFLQQCGTRQDAMLRVALCLETTPQETPSPASEDLLKQMTSLSDTSISFYVCKNKKQLIEDVKSRKANCGYLIPVNLEEKIPAYIQNGTPFLTVIREKKDATTRIVDEIVLSKNYGAIAYHILEDFLEKNTDSSPDSQKLRSTFQSHASNELLFQFQYLNGEEQAILQKKNIGILMLPLRGIVAAILLLTCMAGELLCFQDRAEGKYDQMSRKQKRMAALYSLVIPGLAAGIAALAAIGYGGWRGYKYIRDKKRGYV